MPNDAKRLLLTLALFDPGCWGRCPKGPRTRPIAPPKSRVSGPCIKAQEKQRK